MKTKFRWQPEISFSLIYWSMTAFVFFASWIMALENTRPYPTSIAVTMVSIFFFYLGYRRTLTITNNKITICYARFWKQTTFTLEDIESIQTNGSYVIIQTTTATWEGTLRKKARLQLLELLAKKEC